MLFLYTCNLVLKRKERIAVNNQSLCSSCSSFFFLTLSNKVIFCFKASDSQQIGAVSVEKMPSTKYEIEKFTVALEDEIPTSSAGLFGSVEGSCNHECRVNDN